MSRFPRITFDPGVMGGKACIRGMRVTASNLVELLAAGHSEDEVLASYPYLERDDLRQALAFAATRRPRRWGPSSFASSRASRRSS
jgi:uncharacterized protein (DUF433 family)